MGAFIDIHTLFTLSAWNLLNANSLAKLLTRCHEEMFLALRRCFLLLPNR